MIISIRARHPIFWFEHQAMMSATGSRSTIPHNLKYQGVFPKDVATMYKCWKLLQQWRPRVLRCRQLQEGRPDLRRLHLDGQPSLLLRRPVRVLRRASRRSAAQPSGHAVRHHQRHRLRRLQSEHGQEPLRGLRCQDARPQGGQQGPLAEGPRSANQPSHADGRHGHAPRRGERSRPRRAHDGRRSCSMRTSSSSCSARATRSMRTGSKVWLGASRRRYRPTSTSRISSHSASTRLRISS